MRITVEAWSPEYGGELDLGAPEETTVEPVEICEDRPWEPVDPSDPGQAAAGPVAFVDGTRRIDARLFLSDNGSAPVPGVAGSVGVGAVTCGARGFEPMVPATAERGEARCLGIGIERVLAAGDGVAAALPADGGLSYRPLPVPSRSVESLVGAVHETMRAGEARLALELAGDYLVFVDGPLAVMRPEPVRVVGFIKSHQRRYLDEEAEVVLGELGCGQRTPLFCFGEPRPRYSWYLRLCDLPARQHAWHGLVRCEAPASLPGDEVVALADASAALLPSFASAPHWDARAPQNLVPVAGLEKRLRHLLGDRNLVYRMIRSAAGRADGEGA